jgi:hypothetical protein
MICRGVEANVELQNDAINEWQKHTAKLKSNAN